MNDSPATQTRHEELSTAETMLVEPSRLSPTRRVALALLRSRELSILIVLLLVIAAATIKTDTFLFSENSWRDLLLTPSILVLLAVGQAVVIITRNVDLSVGSILGLTAYLADCSSSVPGCRSSQSSPPACWRARRSA